MAFVVSLLCGKRCFVYGIFVHFDLVETFSQINGGKILTPS